MFVREMPASIPFCQKRLSFASANNFSGYLYKLQRKRVVIIPASFCQWCRQKDGSVRTMEARLVRNIHITR